MATKKRKLLQKLEINRLSILTSPTNLPIVSDSDEDSGIGSNNYYEKPSMEHKISRGNEWQAAVPQLISGPEFCPSAFKECKEMARLNKRRIPCDLMFNASKHLLYLGWKIEFSRSSENLRRRYVAPDGKVYHSFSSLCRSIDHQSAITTRSNYIGEIPECCPKAVKIDQESPIRSNYVGEIRSEAVKNYYLFSQKIKFRGGSSKESKLKATAAKAQLSALGWKFSYVQKRDKREIRYHAPTGKVFASLVTACKWFLEASSDLPSMTEGLDQSIKSEVHKTRFLEASTDLPSIAKELVHKPKRKNCDKSLHHHHRPVTRSSKRVRDRIASSSQQTPRTVLSWLLDNNVVLTGANVCYRWKGKGSVRAGGCVAREGIKCSCCDEVFSFGGFEAHAGGKSHRPSDCIFLEDGRSLFDCQLQLRRRLEGNRSEMKGSWSKNDDDICSVCHYGGELLLCDQCPSSFHTHCVGLDEVPQGDWFCPSCCCQICSKSSDSDLICHQCERRYHAECHRDKGFSGGYSEDYWFCQDTCKNIFYGLSKILGKKVPVGAENLTWTLVKYKESDSCNGDLSVDKDMVEIYSKLNLALHVMHECFEPVKEPSTGRDLVEDVIFSRQSELNRLNCQGFYTILLEKNDELVSAATVRIYGKTVAEVPLVATRFKHRRLGMCRMLMNELEKKLMELGVERLVLPAAHSVLNTWKTSFGFSEMNKSEGLNLLSYTFLNFQGTVSCHKVLNNSVSLLPEAPVKSCDNVKNSAVSEGQQDDMVERESGVERVADDKDSDCSARTAVVYTLPSTKQCGSNSEGVLKYYKRRRIC